jgi:hypothetical protein
MVVKSVRVDGKPRQKVLLYLGTIRQKEVHDPHRRHEFMQEAFYRLDRSDFEARRNALLKSQLVAIVLRAARRL